MAPTATNGPRYRRTPLWRDSNRFRVEVETAVRVFPRYHKCTLGSDLRCRAMNVCRLGARAWLPAGGAPVERPGLVAGLARPVTRGAVLRRCGQPFCQIVEDGYLRGGMKQRSLRWIYTPTGSGAAVGMTASSPSISPSFEPGRGES